MSRSKAPKGQAKGTADAPKPEAAGFELRPGLDLALVAVAVLVVALVGLWFRTDVNRVFDVPKALALKVGGGGILAVWLLRAVFFDGVPWRSVRLFLGPILALLTAMGLSTLFSIDPAMSFDGVYERQFGFQGLVAVTGLFVVAATGVRTRGGAVAGLFALLVVGGTIGAYSILQATGHDPYGFFPKPHNKVYSTLGNATFAGNALALIFPVTSIAVLASAARLFGRIRGEPESTKAAAIGAGAGLVLAALLLVGPGYVAAGDGAIPADGKPAYFKGGVFLTYALLVVLALFGSRGPRSIRAESAAGQRFADGMLHGVFATFALFILAGLFATRTRGAWVATAAALGGGLLLLPYLFSHAPATMRRLRVVGLSTLGALAIGGAGLLAAFPDHVWSRTIFSIPHAFDPSQKIYGQGQGTRRFLWSESVRVLADHDRTILRQMKDREDLKTRGGPDAPDLLRGPASAIERLLVWPFGIGIETYRYAFMSHKSKDLEALDPMTNHDNPHNNYLYLLASCGFVGLGAYLWLLVSLFRRAWANFRPRVLDVSIDGGALRATTNAPSLLADHVKALRPDARIERGLDGVRVTGVDLAALSEELKLPIGGASVFERALAFGVITSFFSYAVYSIAGFDSVACSVFLFFLLGLGAVLFEPSEGDPRRGLRDFVVTALEPRLGAERAKGHPLAKLAFVPAALLFVLALVTISAGARSFRAERAFVGPTHGRMTYEDKIANIESAIRIQPNESFYWQTLGSTHVEMARQYQRLVAEAQRARRADEVSDYVKQADRHNALGEQALYRALEHAWAPENIFITLFQLQYTLRKTAEAERALSRALEHSPHLGPVRANLAALELERGAHDEALANCRWVLEVEPKNALAMRICAQAAKAKGDLKAARGYWQRAQKRAPNDASIAKEIQAIDAALGQGS